MNNRHDFLVVNDWARHSSWAHGFMRFYAGQGIALFALLLVAGWWWARRSGDPRRMAVALWAGLATLIAVGINQPIVNSVQEKRPYDAITGTFLLVKRSADYSFPSDHTTMAGAVAAGLLLLSWRLGLLAVAAALFMAFARVYVGAHYPGDVLAGLAVGAAVAVAGYYALVPLLIRVVTRLEQTPLRPLLSGRPDQATPHTRPNSPATAR